MWGRTDCHLLIEEEKIGFFQETQFSFFQPLSRRGTLKRRKTTEKLEKMCCSINCNLMLIVRSNRLTERRSAKFSTFFY
jgi:hypothetical protein